MNKAIMLAVLFAGWHFSAVVADENIHWDYEGEEGPAHWGDLSGEFTTCGQGRNQSPVDLAANLDSDLPELVFNYSQPRVLEEVNTGHAIQENVYPGNTLHVFDKSFELKQFHFHSPSEHTLQGRHFPMEVHFVHQDEAGNLAVVGLMVEEGAHNALLDRLPSFRAARGEDPYADLVDYNELFTDRRNYFLYNGSLTTPPCSEGVQWIVMKQPLVASPEQIQHYRDLLGFANNRPVQPQNSRLIVQ